MNTEHDIKYCLIEGVPKEYILARECKIPSGKEYRNEILQSKEDTKQERKV